ncbi:TIGR00730 family Rossman fold protein [Paenibacillus turpanensis]|uniref:LOG family protein n=1 Tax=Paenibacillus turpanensis TaxID=2689078 RepID=UPI001408928D|nr:TIGR00730 family Rossman fold protein [Paenibacillus turpanensis]
MKRVCVFAGSNVGTSLEYELAAVKLGQEIASRKLELVYGGSKIGLMGRIADTVLQEGGTVIGVMPRNLFQGEMVHNGLSELHEVDGMHERKALMTKLTDGYIALPGGLGTYEELFEVLSWSQIGIHKKPVGVLNVHGFYEPLVAMLKQTVEAGFMRETNLGLLLVESEADKLLARMAGYTPPIQTNKWSEMPQN